MSIILDKALNKITTLRQLEDECLGCEKCDIGKHKGYFDPHVFSNMNFKAKIMVVGQNPGKEEVKHRRPFMGMSGKNFDKALEEAGLSRKMFYIANACRCFTPDNRPPAPVELTNCKYYLQKEIEAIQPKLVITLGDFGLRQFCGIRGVMEQHGKILHSEEFNVEVFPLLHPSPLNMNKPLKWDLFRKDILFLSEIIKSFG